MKAPMRPLVNLAGGGGEEKSLIEFANRGGPWQLVQPCCSNRRWPARTSAFFSLVAPRLACWNGASGVRTANCTHSFIAVSAGTAVLLPGRVTVCCGRPAFASAGMLLIMQGAWLMLP